MAGHAPAQSNPSKEYIRLGGRVIAIESPAETVTAPSAPSGPGSGTSGTSYTYSTGGATSSLGNPVQYQFNWGDGSNSGWLAAGSTSASHIWSSTNSFTVTAQARSATNPSVVSALSAGLAVAISSTPPPTPPSSPSKPTGLASVATGSSNTYTTGGSGSQVQYLFNWGDGTNSGWLAQGTTSASHAWPSAGTFTVTAQARWTSNPSVVSSVSTGLAVVVTVPPPATPSTPSGAASVATGSSNTYTTGGSGSQVQYLFNWGDGTNSGWLAQGTTSASHAWPSAGTFSVTAQARWTSNPSVVSTVSTGLAVVVTVQPPATPSTPSGAASVTTGSSNTYTTGGSGSQVQYLFNWGDGTNSGWLAQGTTSASHAWPSAGTFSVTAQARWTSNPSVVSTVSTGLAVVVTVQPPATPSTPSGAASVTTGSSNTYTTGGSGSQVQYIFYWDDGTNSGWLAQGTTSASHAWPSAGTFSVTAQARLTSNPSVLSPVSAGFAVVVTAPPPPPTPSTPSGPASVITGVAASYTTGGSGGSVQYLFDWGDGTNSDWLAAGSTSASHSWSNTGTFTVKAQARSIAGATSSWSGGFSVSAQPNYAPAPVGVSPSSGAGNSQWFTFTVSDGNGWNDISDVQMWIGLSPSCHFLYAHWTDTLALVDDSDSGFVGSVPANGGSLSNSQCTVSLGTKSGSGNQLSVPVGVTFKPGFTGSKNVYMATADKQSTISDFVQVGTWSPSTLGLNNASILSISAPDQVTVGQAFTATVTVQNTGPTTWQSVVQNPAAPYRLGSQNPQDNFRWGLHRVELPTGQVAPGATAAFTFSATAPATAGTYAFDWRMVQEAVEWFGGVGRKTITVFPASGGGVGGLESAHPYSNSYDNTWSYTKSGSPSSIDVTFDSQTAVESGYDFIYVMDGNGNNISGSPFTGTSLAGQTVVVPGSTVRIRLTTDSSVTYFGFTVTEVTGNSAPPPPSVQLTDLTHPGGPYRAGDSFVLSISAGAPYSTVTVTQTANGVPGTEWPMGQTDSWGNYSVSGTWSAGEVGTYSQLWRVGGVDATPVLSFSIIP